MRKIRLDVDTLAVDSFGTSPVEAEARGTVQGNGLAIPVTRITCVGYTCDYQTGTPCAAC